MKQLICLACTLFFFNTFAQNINYDTLAIYKVKGKNGFVTHNGKKIMKAKYRTHLSILDNHILIPFYKNRKPVTPQNISHWYLDRNGKKRFAVKSMYALPFFENLALISLADGKTGYINTKGKTVIPFTDFFDSYHSCGRVRKYNQDQLKYGYIDSNNTVKISFLYDQALPFYKGNAIVRKQDDYQISNDWGLIDTSGEALIPFIYWTLTREKENVFIAYSLMNPEDSSSQLSYKCGVVDWQNNILIPFDYDSVKQEGRNYIHKEAYLMCFRKETGWRIVEIGTGRETSCCYEEVRKMKYGYVPVKKQAWGLVDSIGNLKIPFRFRDIKLASRNVVRVCKEDKWSYWKTDGTQMTDFIYDETSEFRFGYTYARSGTQTFLLDSNLNVVLSGFPEEYESGDAIHPVQGPNTLLFLKQGKYGLMNMKGEIIFPAISDDPILFRPEWSEDKPW